MKGIPQYIRSSSGTIVRAYVTYRAAPSSSRSWAHAHRCSALIPGIRFLCFYLTGKPVGHIQSLVLTAILDHRRVPDPADRSAGGHDERQPEDHGGSAVSPASTRRARSAGAERRPIAADPSIGAVRGARVPQRWHPSRRARPTRPGVTRVLRIATAPPCSRCCSRSCRVRRLPPRSGACRRGSGCARSGST